MGCVCKKKKNHLLKIDINQSKGIQDGAWVTSDQQDGDVACRKSRKKERVHEG